MELSILRLGFWAAIAGAGIPVMAVLNARMGRALGDPIHAAWSMFAVGFALMTLICFSTTGSFPNWSRLKDIRPLDLAGGAVVGFYVLSVTFLAPRFGIGNTILFAVSAQIVTSAAIDHFGLFGAVVRPVNAMRIGGVGLLLSGLLLSQLATRPTT